MSRPRLEPVNLDQFRPPDFFGGLGRAGTKADRIWAILKNEPELRPQGQLRKLCLRVWTEFDGLDEALENAQHFRTWFLTRATKPDTIDRERRKYIKAQKKRSRDGLTWPTS